ncbi:MAG: MATE family efflux transporter [Oscillospiraceae bacterium]|nr:MATE family efflux transporter [Oscillospiraceae bacterium]
MDEKAKRKEIYENMAVPSAVLAMAGPTVISQLISLIYNTADTFFIGRLGDPLQVAAVSIAAPAALMITALSNLFGIGGASMYSRAMGKNEIERAGQIASFSLIAAFLLSLFVAVLAAIFPNALLSILGADADTAPHAYKYILWVFILGAVPSMMSLVMSHFVRANGAAKLSGYVLAGGGILNLILDPILMYDFGFGLGISGAAIATFLSNIFTLVFFAVYILRRKSTFFQGRALSFSKEISLGVMGAGLPGMLQTLLASVSNAVLNHLVGAFGGTAIAAMGIAKKLDQIPMSVTIGFSQGIVPLLGYNYSAGNHGRMKKVLRCTMIMALSFSFACVLLFELIPAQLIGFFIEDATTISMGAPLLRIMCVSTPLMAVAFLMVTMFQSVGGIKESSTISLMRKGAVDIPLMLIVGSFLPLVGLAFIQPVSECIAMIVAFIFYRKRFGNKKA